MSAHREHEFCQGFENNSLEELTITDPSPRARPVGASLRRVRGSAEPIRESTEPIRGRSSRTRFLSAAPASYRYFHGSGPPEDGSRGPVGTFLFICILVTYARLIVLQWRYGSSRTTATTKRKKKKKKQKKMMMMLLGAADAPSQYSGLPEKLPGRLDTIADSVQPPPRPPHGHRRSICLTAAVPFVSLLPPSRLPRRRCRCRPVNHPRLLSLLLLQTVPARCYRRPSLSAP